MQQFFQRLRLVAIVFILLPSLALAQNTSPDSSSFLQGATWTADNGNGSFTNPLFYDEFSDPDMIRVGDDYYLTGTTMHTMPGLPVLHSKDLVNWDFLCYAVDTLDYGPDFRLDSNKNIYGQGIWAPSFRYHNGKFYIFSNINRFNTHLFTATDPKGPWTHTAMKRSFHDLSVLFDDDGKVYVVWGYDEVHLAELNDDFTDMKPGTEQIIVKAGSGAGEGSHFYKIDGRYYITSTNYDPVCYQVCLRANNPRGPYEVAVMSAKESLGIGTGWRVANERNNPPFKLIPPEENFVGRIPMHQGGIVQTQSGEWWGWSMMDHNAVGRLTCLSPVTWKDGWPYFGLPGNLTRSPRSWVKPNTGFKSQPHAPYRRSDDFNGAALQPVWQWNHAPVANKWSLKSRKGYLRLNAMPAKEFWWAKNTLTQRGIGPTSIVTAEAELAGMKNGDIAGLGLLNMPYAWVAVVKKEEGLELQQFDQQKNKPFAVKAAGTHVWFRALCNFDNDTAFFSYSFDGVSFEPIGEAYTMTFSLRTFQGVRYSLFNYNTLGTDGGYVDFNSFAVAEPGAHGLTRPIPAGKLITLSSLADSTVLVNWKGFLKPVASNEKIANSSNSKFLVVDKGNGRIALQSLADSSWVTVKGLGGMADVRIEKAPEGDASVFQWQDMLRGDLMLMSLSTHRYLFADPHGRSLCSADAPGTRPDRKDGACFSWIIVE